MDMSFTRGLVEPLPPPEMDDLQLAKAHFHSKIKNVEEQLANIRTIRLLPVCML